MPSKKKAVPNLSDKEVLALWMRYINKSTTDLLCASFTEHLTRYGYRLCKEEKK